MGSGSSDPATYKKKDLVERKKHTQGGLYKNSVQQNNKPVTIPVGLTLLISQVWVCYNQKIAYPIDTPTVLAADEWQKITQLCASKTDLACG